MGASKGFQSLCGHSLDSTLPLFSLQLKVLRDWYEFEYWLDHLCHVALVCSFHSMSLACFLLRAFVSFLAWHTPFTLLSLTRCFQICSWSSFYTVHLSRAQYLILCWILDLIFNSMLIFSLQKGERHVFTFTHFSRESPWSPYHLYLMELELKVDSRICGYRWGIDLMIVCFSHLFYLGLLMGIL